MVPSLSLHGLSVGYYSTRHTRLLTLASVPHSSSLLHPLPFPLVSLPPGGRGGAGETWGMGWGWVTNGMRSRRASCLYVGRFILPSLVPRSGRFHLPRLRRDGVKCGETKDTEHDTTERQEVKGKDEPTGRNRGGMVGLFTVALYLSIPLTPLLLPSFVSSLAPYVPRSSLTPFVTRGERREHRVREGVKGARCERVTRTGVKSDVSRFFLSPAHRSFLLSSHSSRYTPSSFLSRMEWHESDGSDKNKMWM